MNNENLSKLPEIDNSIKFYSNRFDNIISSLNQSPKLEPIKEAIRRKFNLNIKPSFFGLPKDSSKYTELLSEYNKEVVKEKNYLMHFFGNDYEKVLDKIVDEKYKRTQDYFEKLGKEQKKRLFIDDGYITLYRGYTSEGIASVSGASKQIYDIIDKLSIGEKVEIFPSDVLTSFTTNSNAAWYFAGGVAELDGFVIKIKIPLSWVFESYLTNDNLNQEFEYQGEEITYDESDEEIEEYLDEYETITDTENDVLVLLKFPIIIDLDNIIYMRIKNETLIEYIVN